MDLPFLVLVLTLVAFGLVMLCSASSAVALYRRQDAFAYVRPQLLYAAMDWWPCGRPAGWTTTSIISLRGRCWQPLAGAADGGAVHAGI